MNARPATLFRNGNLDDAISEIRSSPNSSPADLELRASIEYMQGQYAEAASHLHRVVDRSPLQPVRRYRARRKLSLCYFQENRFEDAAKLPLRDPLTRLMSAFTSDPNVITWAGDQRATLPFLQEESWELPRIAVTASGHEMVARIDTGGDLFSIPWSAAEQMGVTPVANSTGWFAGGHRARTGRGILESLDLGGVTITNVPVSINSFDHAILGTGLLRQFLSTLDYPAGELVLKPRESRGAQSGFPFVMAGTHLLIASGTVNGIEARLLVDSGLEVTNDGCFLAPESTLTAAGIAVPESESVEGISGAGRAQLEIGEFVVDELSLGNERRYDMRGLTGIFPAQLTKARTLGFPLAGLISHNFLRHYRWTLDFAGMTMSLEDC